MLRKLSVYFIFLSLLGCGSSSSNMDAVEPVDQQSAPEVPQSGSSTSDTVKRSILTKNENNFYRRVTVENGKLSIDIPKSFKKMSQAMIDRKYPRSSTRPTEVYTNNTYGVNIGFVYTTQPASSGDLPSLQTMLLEQIKASGGENIKSSIQQINGSSYVVIEFTNNALDTKIFNLLFVTDIDGRVFIGTFNCVSRLIGEWEPRAREIVSSLNKK